MCLKFKSLFPGAQLLAPLGQGAFGVNLAVGKDPTELSSIGCVF